MKIELRREGKFIIHPLHDALNSLLLQTPPRRPGKQLQREHDLDSRMSHTGVEAAKGGQGSVGNGYSTRHTFTSHPFRGQVCLSAFTFLGPETDCSRAGRMREDAQSGSCSPRTARSQGVPSRQLFSSCQAVRPRRHRQTILHVFIKHGDKWLRRCLRAFFFTVRFLRASFDDLSQSRGFTYPPYTDDG